MLSFAQLSKSKVKLSLVSVVAEVEVDFIVGAQYLSGLGSMMGWWVETNMMGSQFQLKLKQKFKLTLAIKIDLLHTLLHSHSPH